MNEKYWLRTNTKVEAEKSLEKLDETLDFVKDDVYQWKWAIIVLINCIQCFMVLNLEGTNQADVVRDNLKDKRHIKRHLSPDVQPSNAKLLDIMDLFKKIKATDNYKSYLEKKVFKYKISEYDEAMEEMVAQRNEFMHFFPTGRGIWTKEYPIFFMVLLDLIKYLILGSGRILIYFSDKEIKIMESNINKIGLRLTEIYNNG